MKTILLTSLLAVALSSGVALASEHHHHHHLAANPTRQDTQNFYGVYQGTPAPAATPAYHDPFGTYSVDPSPVTDQ